ncbi:MAG TPA: ion channel [Longimicrobiaceae bacterium]|nr:ion channel [Longimicrobiaceae bacterium]
MSLQGVVLVALGIAVLVVLSFDIIGTILHSWVGLGPIARRVVKALWWVMRVVERRCNGIASRGVIGWVGPFLVPVVILAWVLLGVFGFALIHLPFMPADFSSGKGIPTSGTLFQAVYYSAVTLFTLGYGSVVPTASATRLLAIMEAAWGFSVVSLVTSYYVNLVGADRDQKALAETLYFQAGESADAAQILIRQLKGRDTRTLEDELGRTRDALLRAQISFEGYTTLFYLRPPQPEYTFLRTLYLLQQLSSLVDHALDPDELPRVAGAAQRLGLRGAVDRARTGMLRAVLGAERELPHDGGEDREEAERFRAAVRRLREAGIPTRDEGEAVRDHCRCMEWGRQLRAVAAALGEEWGGVTGAEGGADDEPRPRGGDSHPLRHGGGDARRRPGADPRRRAEDARIPVWLVLISLVAIAGAADRAADWVVLAAVVSGIVAANMAILAFRARLPDNLFWRLLVVLLAGLAGAFWITLAPVLSARSALWIPVASAMLVGGALLVVRGKGARRESRSPPRRRFRRRALTHSRRSVMGALFITGVGKYHAPDGRWGVMVRGFAMGVSRLRVRARCGRAAAVTALDVPPSREWTAHLPAEDVLELLGDGCDTLQVHAESMEDPKCWDNWGGTLETLAVAGPPDAAAGQIRVEPADGDEGGERVARPCPTVRFAPVRVEPGDRSECLVALEAGVEVPDRSVLVARLRDVRSGDVLATESGDSGTLTLRARRRYQAGSHTVRVELLVPTGCAASEMTFRLPATAQDDGAGGGGPDTSSKEEAMGDHEPRRGRGGDERGPDLEGCPHINFAPLEFGESSDGSGRSVRLAATVSLPGEGELVARIRNSRTGEVLTTESADGGSVTLRDERDWREGEHTVAVEVLSPEGCPSVSSTFRVEAEKERSDGVGEGGGEARGSGEGGSGAREREQDGAGDGGRDAGSRRGPDVRIEVVAPPGSSVQGEGRDGREDGSLEQERPPEDDRRRDPERDGGSGRARESGESGRSRPASHGGGRRPQQHAPRVRDRRAADRERDDPPSADRRGAEGERGADRGPPVCPRIRFSRPELGGRAEGGGRRVKISARVELPEGRRLVARLRDCDTDRVLVTESSDSGQLTLQGRCDYEEGEHSVAVEILNPEECPEFTTTFHVPSADEDDSGDGERLRRIKQGRRHRADEDQTDDGEQEDDGSDRSKLVGVLWTIALAAYLVVLSVESGFLASALAFGIASAVMAMAVGVSLMASGPARWAGWTYGGVALAAIVVILLLALTGMVSVGGVLLAAGIAAVGFAIGAAIVSVYGNKRSSEEDRREQRRRDRDERYRNRETEP